VTFLVQNGAVCGQTNLILTVKGKKTLFFVGSRGDIHTNSYVQPPSVSSTLFHTLSWPLHSERNLLQNEPGFNSARLGKHSSHSTCNMAVVSGLGKCGNGAE
jgi:hypothetical protein